MFDSNQTDLDRDVEASMRMFKKAQTGPVAEIQPRTASRVLLVLDGSAQDQTAVEAAAYLQQRFGAETWVLDARENVGSEPELAAKMAEKIPGAQWLDRGEGPAYDAILQAERTQQPDLVILPCPFAREFESVGADSAGTVIDVMLSRCHTPMLVIRRTDQSIDRATEEIAILVSGEVDNEKRAAAWAVGFAQATTRLSLDLVVDQEYYENIREILAVLSPEKTLDIEELSSAMADAHARLHAALMKTAAEAPWRYSLRPLVIDQAPPSLTDAARPLLIVMPLEVDDRFAQGFVQDRIRRSPHPLLIVPSYAGHGTQGDLPGQDVS